MRGWMIIRSPDDRRNTACLARRYTCSIVLPRRVLIRRCLVTSRMTSVFLSWTSAIRHPSRRGAISRTIVSTSGSSGTLDLTPGDVAAPGLALEGDALGGAPARLRGERHRGAKTSHAEHAATGGPQSPLVVVERARVKDNDIVAQFRRLRQPDRRPLFRIVGIAPRGQDGGHRGPFDRQHLLRDHRIPAPLRDRHEMLAESRQ